MGWNNLSFNYKRGVLKNISEKDYFYFLHSYFFDAKNKMDILAYTTYGNKIPSVISNENILGMQFHPEKSGTAGQKILLNWLKQ